MTAGMFDEQLLTQLRDERVAIGIRVRELRCQIREKVAELEALERRLNDIKTRENYIHTTI